VASSIVVSGAKQSCVCGVETEVEEAVVDVDEDEQATCPYALKDVIVVGTKSIKISIGMTIFTPIFFVKDFVGLVDDIFFYPSIS
jgi:hypothetical protein